MNETLGEKVVEWCFRRTFKFVAVSGCATVPVVILLHVFLQGVAADAALVLVVPWCLMFTMWSSQRAAVWAAHETPTLASDNRGGIIFPRVERRPV